MFANGDITTREQYVRLLERGAYGAAIGRGAVGKPYVFSQVTGKPWRMNLYDVIYRQTNNLAQVFCDRVVCNEMKKHVAAYLKGKRNAKPIRNSPK